jgi:cell division protein FtsQ
VNNFKAFYVKAIKDELLDKYSTINLQFDNQVVCVKK